MKNAVDHTPSEVPKKGVGAGAEKRQGSDKGHATHLNQMQAEFTKKHGPKDKA